MIGAISSHYVASSGGSVITGMTATTTKTGYAGSTVDRVIDGDPATFFSPDSGWSASADYVQLDLAATYTLSQVVVNTNIGAGDYCWLETSTDGTTWTAYGAALYGATWPQTVTQVATARYIRLRLGNTGAWYSIAEITPSGSL